MAMTDRLKQAQGRYSDIKLEWNLGGDPGDVTARLEAVIAWLDSGVKAPAVAVRATQILLLDPQRPGLGKRPVLKRVFKELGPAWLSARGDELHLLQAMILAARPERGEGGLGLVGLMGAGWEVMRGREQFLVERQSWEAKPVNQGSRALDMPSIDRSYTSRLNMNASFLEDAYQVKDALAELWRSCGSALNFEQFSGPLLTVLDFINTHGLAYAPQTAIDGPRMQEGQESLRQLHRLAKEALAFDGFGSHFVAWVKPIYYVIEGTVVDLPPVEPYLAKLTENTSTRWWWNTTSHLILPILTAIFNGSVQIVRFNNVSNAFHGHSNAIESALSSISPQLTAALEAARPAELELLWWGQARYCHTLQTPFRRLLKDPAQRTRACYAAINEAADRAQRLDPEPSAAFLVETLTSMGFDVDERRPVHSWLQELCLHTDAKDSPGGPLAELAGEDSTGLPVTWARLNARAPFNEEAASAALAMPLDAEIDLGDWATWILRERVLDLRMRA